MIQNTLSKTSIWLLSLSHVLLLTLSNVLVQYPFDILGYHTTWGAFTYPAIFILTDLTIRLTNAKNARVIIFRSMIPGLVISYFVASAIEATSVFTWDNVFSIHPMPLRIALACFVAYTVGQLFDVSVFQRFRNQSSWWLAPTLSTSLGNFLDTVIFFTIAFYHCSNPFLSQHWPEIAMVDVFFKIIISLVAFVPIYGLVLNAFSLRYANKRVGSL